MSENNLSRRELPQAMAAVLLLDGAPEAQATAWSLSFTSTVEMAGLIRTKKLPARSTGRARETDRARKPEG
jgi:hypothetical protein